MSAVNTTVVKPYFHVAAVSRKCTVMGSPTSFYYSYSLETTVHKNTRYRENYPLY